MLLERPTEKKESGPFFWFTGAQKKGRLKALQKGARVSHWTADGGGGVFYKASLDSHLLGCGRGRREYRLRLFYRIRIIWAVRWSFPVSIATALYWSLYPLRRVYHRCRCASECQRCAILRFQRRNERVLAHLITGAIPSPIFDGHHNSLILYLYITFISRRFCSATKFEEVGMPKVRDPAWIWCVLYNISCHSILLSQFISISPSDAK